MKALKTMKQKLTGKKKETKKSKKKFSKREIKKSRILVETRIEEEVDRIFELFADRPITFLELKLILFRASDRLRELITDRIIAQHMSEMYAGGRPLPEKILKMPQGTKKSKKTRSLEDIEEDTDYERMYG